MAVMRPRMVAFSSSVALPRSIAFVRPLSIDATIASALACERDRTTTSYPDRAITSANPEPMMPDPRTPTRLISAMSRP